MATDMTYQLSGRKLTTSLRWRHNGCDGVSYHQPHDCLSSRLFRRRSKKTSKLCVTGILRGTGEFLAQMASSAENVFIWWRHHVRKVRSCLLVHILCILYTKMAILNLYTLYRHMYTLNKIQLFTGIWTLAFNNWVSKMNFVSIHTAL